LQNIGVQFILLMIFS